MTWYYTPSTSAPATEDSNSPSDSPESLPEPWLTLSGTPTQRPLSWRGWERRTWIRLLSGLTSPPSTVLRGVAEWISSLPASPASRSRAQGDSVELTMTGGSGLPSGVSFVTWDHDSCSWRTSPDLFGQGFLTSSPTLPRWGSMRNGVCSPRPPLVPLTSGSGSGSLPTPTAMDCRRSGGNPDTTGTHGVTLTDAAVRQWATPAAREDQRSPEAHMAMKARMGGGRTEATSLTVQAKMWPTPTSHDPKDLGAPPSQRDRNSHMLPVAAAVHGPQAVTTPTDGESGSPKVDLNPRFVESLMGLPQGWLTPSTSVGTDSFQRWLHTHSLLSPTGSASTSGGGEAA